MCSSCSTLSSKCNVEVSSETERKSSSFCLHFAIRNMDLNGATLLIRFGYEVNKSDQTGFSPLTLAAKNGLTEIVSKLIESGADINTSMQTM